MTTVAKFVIGVMVVLSIAGAMRYLVSLSGPAQVDEHTKQLCREWAAADHSGGVPPERLKWLKERGVWDEFDWYGSCILNNEPGRFNYGNK